MTFPLQRGTRRDAEIAPVGNNKPSLKTPDPERPFPELLRKDLELIHCHMCVNDLGILHPQWSRLAPPTPQ